MTSILLEFQLVIRNAANTADAVTFSSVRGDTLPYLEGPPTCDGQEINPLTGEFRSGSYTGYIVDAITSGTTRAFTSQLEDSNFRQQLVGRVALWKFRTNQQSVTVSGGGAIAGATSLPVVALSASIPSGITLTFASGKQATLTASASAGATSLTVAALAAGISGGDTASVWVVYGAGYLTRLALVSGARWGVTVSDATRVEDNAVAFSPKKGALALSANASSGATSLSVTALPFAIAKGYVLSFLSGKSAQVAAAAASGATSVSVVGGIVTVAAPGAALNATSLPVNALSSAIPKGFTLTFASGKYATLSADASVGATSLSVFALGAAISTGDTAPACPALSSGDSAPISESFAAYFARWPNRGCIFGGPITGGFLDVPDLGGWVVFASENTSVGGEDATSGTTYLPLAYPGGYVPPTFLPEADINKQGMAQVPNSAADQLVARMYTQCPGFEFEFKSFWPSLVYQIAPASTGFTGASTEFYAPEDAAGFSGVSMNGKGSNGIIDTQPKNKRHGLFAMTAALSISSTPLRIRGVTALPSEQSPLYWTGHPIDLATALLDEQQRSYDATSVTTVRQAIGADRRLSLRITSLPKVNDILRDAVYGPFGIGVRMNGSGVLEFFTTRIFNNSPPSTTITAADIRHDARGAGVQSWFELDESTAIRQVVFEYDAFYLLGSTIENSSGTFKYPPDGVGVQHIRIERNNGDPGAVGSGVASFNVPGMVHAKDAFISRFVPSTPDDTVQSWVNQLAYEVFDRWGRSAIVAELPLIRGGAGDALKLGDELLNATPQIPNKNKRYGDDNSVGARAMQIVRMTPSPVGALVKMIDSGPNAAALGTLPTFTVAAGPGRLGLRFARVTITNAPTLNAALCGVEIQMAVTTGGVPAATDYTAAGRITYGNVPASPIALPGTLNGRVVYVRMRATKFGSRPSAWTSASSVTLTALNPPSSLVATPNGSDGSQCLATWVPGANADQAAVDVYLRPSAQPAATAMRQAILDASSSRYNLERLTPNTSYTVGVQSRDVQTGDTSTMVEATFTTANVTVTLPKPKRSQIFVGRPDPKTGVLRMDGTYGLAVQATTAPSSVEFWEALETGVGAGTYGTAALVDTIPSAQGDWTMVMRSAPNDGLRRQLQARHVRDGSTASSLTTALTITPWTATVALPKVAPETSLERFSCKVDKSATQNIGSGGSGTAVTFDTERYDNGSLHDTVTNPARITIPTDGDIGVWHIFGSVGWDANATGVRILQIVKNGSTILSQSVVPGVNSATYGGNVQPAYVIDRNPSVGDYYELWVLQDSGGVRVIQSSIDKTWFGAVHVW